MVMRGEWQLRDAGICLRHQAPLTELWTEVAPARRFDFGSRLEEIRGSVLAKCYDQPVVNPSSYDIWLDERLATGVDPTWLRDFSLYATTTICGLLGAELLKANPDASKTQIARHRVALLSGFEVLRNGEGAFREALARLAARADGPLDEAGKAFGNLFDRLSRDLLFDEAFAPFRQILREYILSHWPYAVGDTLLGERVNERHLHSVVTAARETGVWDAVLEAILTDAGAFSPDDPRARSRKTFIAKDYASILAEIPTWVGPGEMLAAMGATKAAFASLVADGLLVPRTRAPKIIARWRLSDGLALVSELTAVAQSISADQSGWESLQQAKKRKRVAVGVIIAGVRAGEMSIARQQDVAGYNGLRVRAVEINALAARLRDGAPQAAELEDTVSAAAFGRKVGLRDGARFLALAEAGHVPTHVVLHPSTRRKQHRMTDEDIAVFHRKFLTVSTIEAEFGLHRNTILAVLRAHKVEPFSFDGKPAGSIWLRDAIEKLFTHDRNS